jgi:hypothetical protein
VSAEKPDLELIKRQIEAMLDDYARAIEEYAAFRASMRAKREAAE